MRIRKAVFPLTGLGANFLPATKAIPKEMLPVVDKPLIQYAVEEASRAGITQMIFITGWFGHVIEEHFANYDPLEIFLEESENEELLEVVQAISPSTIEFSYVKQNQPLSLGDALLSAESIIGDEPFAVLLANNLIDDSRLPCLSSMMQRFEQDGQAILAVQPVPWTEVHYQNVVGVVDAAKNYSPILTMVENPKMELAPSNLATVGRFLFTPAIFSCLREALEQHGEIQFVDAISCLLAEQTVQSYQFQGKRYDCRTKLGYLQAIVEVGLNHPAVSEALSQYLRFKSN